MTVCGLNQSAKSGRVLKQLVPKQSLNYWQEKMKTFSLLALLLASMVYAQNPAAAPATAPASSSAAADTPKPTSQPLTATGGTQKIMLMLSATDSEGNPVANLSKDSVAISDNGHPVVLSELHAMPDLPIDLGIILLGSMDFSQQQNAAIEIAKMLRPGKDRAFVMVAGGTKGAKAELPWLSDQTQLINQIKSLDKHVGYPDPFE